MKLSTFGSLAILLVASHTVSAHDTRWGVNTNIHSPHYDKHYNRDNTHRSGRNPLEAAVLGTLIGGFFVHESSNSKKTVTVTVPAQECILHEEYDKKGNLISTSRTCRTK